MLNYRRVDHWILKVPSFWTQHSSQPRSCHAVFKPLQVVVDGQGYPQFTNVTVALQLDSCRLWGCNPWHLGLSIPIYPNLCSIPTGNMFKSMNVWDFVWFPMGFCICLSYSQNPVIETGSMLGCRWPPRGQPRSRPTPKIDFLPRLYDVHPSRGSWAGGSVVVLSGDGLQGDEVGDSRGLRNSLVVTGNVWNHGILWLSQKNGNVITPTDELIFFRGVVGIPPTSYLFTSFPHIPSYHVMLSSFFFASW